MKVVAGPVKWVEVENYLKALATNHREEQCGLIAWGEGRWTDVGVTFRSAGFYVFPTQNTHPDPLAHFEQDRADMAVAFDQIISQGLKLWGLYHTHPSGTWAPSGEDIRQWRYPPEYRMVIATTGRVQCWVMEYEGEVHQVEVS